MLFKELMKVTVMTSTLGGGGVCIAKSEQITSKKDRTDNKILDIPRQHGKSKLVKYQTYCNNSCMCPPSGSNSNSLSQRSVCIFVIILWSYISCLTNLVLLFSYHSILNPFNKAV